MSPLLAIGPEPLHIDRLVTALAEAGADRGAEGAIVTFLGLVRNHNAGRQVRFLEYEAYEPLALKTFEQISAETYSRWPHVRLALHHRIGRLEIGEASVAIVVSAPHRKPAFDAALEGINRLKKLVPIWKKEHFADGEVWVEGEWDDNAPVAAKS